MKLKYCFLLTIFGAACKQKYVAKTNTPAAGYLVVEGFINVGDSATNFTLSRSSSLDSAQIILETGAEMDVQSSNGASFSLTETSPGHYSISQIPIDLNQQYRIHIKTSNSKEYFSDLEEAKISPPIDSVYWAKDVDGLDVSVSTHDVQNKTIYYQWEYEETWQYSTMFQTHYIRIAPGVIVLRDSSETIPINCWASDSSTSIIISSSEKLSNDVINQFPLTQISYSTNKLIHLYSILVKQYALTKEWYEWQQKLQANTEQLGSIFDPQPSDVNGNIHCATDPNELVIGFVGCSSISEKRIFISHSAIPDQPIPTGYENCKDTVYPWIPPYTHIDKLLSGPGFDVVDVILDSSGIINTVFIVSEDCVDCRFHGGTSIKPDFWP